GQIGIGKIQEGDPRQITKNLQSERGPVTLADMTNRGVDKAATMPGPDILSRHTASRSRIRYDKPEGWKEAPDPSGFSTVMFEIPAGATKASVTALPRRPDELLLNVNRWRKQLQLEPIDETGIRKALRPLELA